MRAHHHYNIINLPASANFATMTRMMASQKHPPPSLSNFLPSHSETFCELIKDKHKAEVEA